MVTSSDAHDNPEVEAAWIAERRMEILAYLEREQVSHGPIAKEPAWCLAPYISLWRVPGDGSTEGTGWWVICGDLPTDYIPSHGTGSARAAIACFARNWKDMAQRMLRGEPCPGARVGEPSEWPDLGDLLARRAELLSEWASDEDIWE